MAANSRPIVLDVAGRPAPQYYNPTTDAYEYLQGEAGAARSILWGPDGQALSVVSRKLEVRASEIEDLLAAIRDTDGIRRIAEAVDIADRAARLLGKVGADDGALATLGALADAAKTDPAQAASVIALLKGLLQTLRTDSAKVQLTGSIVDQVDGLDVIRTKQMALAYRSWDLLDTPSVVIAAGASVADSWRAVNGFSELAVLIRNAPYTAATRFIVRLRWSGRASPLTHQIVDEDVIDTGDSPQRGAFAIVPTKSQYVSAQVFNRESVDITVYCHLLLRV